MKLVKLSLALLIVMLPALVMAGDVTVVITGLRNTEGNVYIGLFDDPETWADPGLEAVTCKSGEITNSEIKVICNAKPGVYTAAAFHDEDSDDELSVNFLGMPVEGYGFANAAPDAKSHPDFDKAKFEVTDADQQIKINISY